MQDIASETVGARFQNDLLQSARDKTLQLIDETSKLIRPGMKEKEAEGLLREIQRKLGSTQSFHPPMIRFGENTLLPYGKKGQEVTLGEIDIYFFDIGAVFDGHEGDVGRPFVVGDDSEMSRCCSDAEKIWHLVREHWSLSGASGSELYEFAKSLASARGWLLTLQKAGGHRIADFPHAIHMRGALDSLTKKPLANRWILEIQIRHPSRPFGAFYEDLLN